MPAKRIIPCMDIAGGRVVKGVRFTDIGDAGDPVELAREYEAQGADELLLLDIEASAAGTFALAELTRKVAQAVFIPFCVGGGIRSLDDVHRLMERGADKISLCSILFEKPELIAEIAGVYGSQCVVVSVDAKRNGEDWICFARGGRLDTGIAVLDWVQKVQDLGAGEILLNSIDRDGTGNGYDIGLLSSVSNLLSIPLIASSGAGRLEHMKEALVIGGADAVLAASLLHSGKTTIAAIKQYLSEEGVEVR